MKKLNIVLSFLVISSSAFAATEPVNMDSGASAASATPNDSAPSENRPADPPLEAQLKQLEMPANMAPAAVSQEKLYSVQNRFSPLRKKSEITVGGSYLFRGNGYLTMTEANLDYRYHFNDRWNINLGGGYSFNSLTTSGQELVDNGQVTDIAYPKYRGHLLLGYNTFYGKIRFGMDSTAYFDQYIAIGPGLVQTAYSNAIAGVADVGFAFWLKKWGSLRFGIRNEVFTEKRKFDSVMAYHMSGHVDFGIMLGGSDE